MELWEVRDIASLAKRMHDMAVVLKASLTAVLFFDKAQELLRMFMRYQDVTVEYINMDSPTFGEYEKEYYVTIFDDASICIEQAYDQDRDEYNIMVCDAMFFDGDANSRAAIINDGCLQMELAFSDDEDVKKVLRPDFDNDTISNGNTQWFRSNSNNITLLPYIYEFPDRKITDDPNVITYTDDPYIQKTISIKIE